MYCGFENLKLALKDCEAYSDFFFCRNALYYVSILVFM